MYIPCDLIVRWYNVDYAIHIPDIFLATLLPNKENLDARTMLYYRRVKMKKLERMVD